MELIKWLKKAKGFSYGDATYARRILDNNEKVSRWCLTYIDKNNIMGKAIRSKFYNKLLCQITSGARYENFISTNIHLLAEIWDERLLKLFL